VNYRIDSDIVIPYGKVGVKKHKNCNQAGALEFENTSGRQFGLLEYLPPNTVDIYGYCGSKRRPRGNETNDSCWEKVENNYKLSAKTLYFKP
jgi:hypothetical protein